MVCEDASEVVARLSRNCTNRATCSPANRRATNVHSRLSNEKVMPCYCRHVSPVCGERVYMLQNNLEMRTAAEMSALRHFEGRWHRAWCGLVVLVAVCSLTVSVATRYSSPLNPSSPAVKTVRTHTTPDAKRQRLAKNAADWAPPLVCFDALRSPSSYPRIAPAGPPIPSLLLEQSLYNRPPPSSEFLS